MKRILLLCLTAVFTFATSSELWAQDRTVTGRITSAEDGSALPGVNVVLKGTLIGTVSDSEGKYSLSVPSTGTLVFSFIGLASQELEIGSKSVVDVQMAQDARQLNEVIVTTAGGLQARARELGSSQVVINNDKLTAGRALNVAAGLQGKIAGLQINATGSGVNPDYRVVLRGSRSLLGNNQALIVLDNVIVPNSVLGSLNQNDIESINILQGAGAAALYGSQASNGALIITTKKGKSGKTEIAVTQNNQLSTVAFFPKIQTKFGSGGSAYGTNPDGSPVFNYLENQSYGPAYDGSLRALGPKLEDGTQLYTPYTYKPGHADFWQHGTQSTTDFSLSSGDEKSTFLVSGQLVTITGTTPGDKYVRGNIRINGTKSIGDKVKVVYSTLYNPSKTDISSATDQIYTNMLNMPSNVDITKFKDWKNNKFATPNGFYNPWYLNPYFSAATNRELDKNTNLTGNIQIKYTPFKGLDLTARQGVSARFFTQKTHVEGYKYSDYAKNTDQSSKADIPSSVAEYSGQSLQSISDLLAEYDKIVGNFNINVVGGLQLKQNTTRVMGAGVGGLVVTGLYNLSNGTGTPTVGEADFMTRQVGVYGQARVGFKDYLFVTGRVRNDWDSRLIKQNRSFFYPSAEASLIISDAIPAIKDNNLISFLKLRGGVSKTGQVNLGNAIGNGFEDLGAYETKSTFGSNNSNGTPNGFPYGGLAGYSVNNVLVSKSLKPEFTHQYEAGFDLNLFNDRITSVFTYYHSLTDNQTVPTALSSTTGYSTLLTNVGKTTSSGIELALHITPIKTADLEVTVGGNYTYTDNKVVSISAQVPQIILKTMGSATSVAKAGYAFPVIMGLDYNRDPKGRVIVDRVSGLPTSTSAPVVLGNATPKHRLGLDGQVNYKGIRFSILFEYRTGYKIFNGIGTELDWSGTGYRTAAYNRQSFVMPNSVYDDGEGNYVVNKDVAIQNGNGNAGFWSDGINRNTTSNYVTSGTFVKLREIALAYDIPTKFLTPTKILKSATISVQGRNLFMWMAKDNYYTDPEYSSAGSTGNGTGLNDIGLTPPVRYYGATLSLKL